MKKKYLILAGSLLFASVAMQSCLEFDDPGDELGLGEIIIDKDEPDTPELPDSVGNVNNSTELIKMVTAVDTFNYTREVTEEEVANAIAELDVQFRQARGGRYCLRGGKEADYPGAHAYQRQYSLGPDTYAQYFTVPHRDFMYGTLTSTYDISADFNGGPLGAYTMAKNTFMPLLNNPAINVIPEIKAVNLLFYCLAAQENADLAGPFTYFEDKQNVEDPRVYNNVRSIYHGIVDNIDAIVACLNNYDNRPEWYKVQIEGVLNDYHDTNRRQIYEGDYGFNTYIRLANSLKLRMAMHIVKVEPQTAKKWAEEAVASGVIECAEDQQGLYPMDLGFGHPLDGICNGWGDLVLSASFESLLLTLGHPYADYVFEKNSEIIINEEEEEILEKGTRVCGLRGGTLVGTGQEYSMNQLQAFSKLNTETFQNGMPPLYFIKWAEVDFLRAEGALRGWNMGGSAQSFYERGIRNGYLEDPTCAEGLPYLQTIDAYMADERLNMEYFSIDPTGEGEPWETTTKIGVAWDDTDDNEIKLEKIITQKYIALFPLSTEAWTEMRRTGYPKLFAVLNPDDGDGSVLPGEMIRRIPWVPTDPRIQSIVNTYAIPALGGSDQQATRLWWDTPDESNF